MTRRFLLAAALALCASAHAQDYPARPIRMLVTIPPGGAPDIAALHIVTVTRGLAVLERAFGDEVQLRKIATHTVNLVLDKKSR